VMRLTVLEFVGYSQESLSAYPAHS
jgi:hypothetical protein